MRSIEPSHLAASTQWMSLVDFRYVYVYIYIADLYIYIYVYYIAIHTISNLVSFNMQEKIMCSDSLLCVMYYLCCIIYDVLCIIIYYYWSLLYYCYIVIVCYCLLFNNFCFRHYCIVVAVILVCFNHPNRSKIFPGEMEEGAPKRAVLARVGQAPTPSQNPLVTHDFPICFPWCSHSVPSFSWISLIVSP